MVTCFAVVKYMGVGTSSALVQIDIFTSSTSVDLEQFVSIKTALALL